MNCAYFMIFLKYSLFVCFNAVMKASYLSFGICHKSASIKKLELASIDSDFLCFCNCLVVIRYENKCFLPLSKLDRLPFCRLINKRS